MLFIYDLSEDKSGFDGLIIDTVFLGTGNSLQGVRGHTFLCTRKCHFWQAYIYSYSFLRKKMQWKDQQRPTLRWGGGTSLYAEVRTEPLGITWGKVWLCFFPTPYLLASLFALRFPPPYQWIQYSGFNTSSQEKSIALQAIRLWEWRR